MALSRDTRDGSVEMDGSVRNGSLLVLNGLDSRTVTKKEEPKERKIIRKKPQEEPSILLVKTRVSGEKE
ncbi:hypothetical protein AMEX_G18737 [Astyanax mexicanus]|uniref:Uncharacterized protein n=1 Tax=Astyanax mexicanus TaxID=7994 RepID=A0A8T2LD48_ASTMX|nr:hypothetical protein AMEX_G18737 [Astyanax mexicanus]